MTLGELRNNFNHLPDDTIIVLASNYLNYEVADARLRTAIVDPNMNLLLNNPKIEGRRRTVIEFLPEN